ncbi:MAG: hypothetical protein IK016_06665 [Lachnospiraceae bacterium]|nr:hypothetical protein [Lachnospiraceae bacterium]
MNKKILKVMTVVTIATVFFLGGCGNRTANDAKKVEGAGFNSPEEAITAYAEAFKEQNLEKMMSTFAVETYCERYDANEYTRWMSAITPQNYMDQPTAPTTDPFTRELNIESRRGSLAESFRYHKLAILSATCTDNEVKALLDESLETGVALHGDENIIRLASEVTRYNASSIANVEISIGETLQPEELSNEYVSLTSLRRMKRHADVCRADGFKSVAIVLNIDGEKAVLCMDTVRYGDKWYNLYCGGNVGNMLLLHNKKRGLAISDSGVDVEALLSKHGETGRAAREELKAAEAEWTEQHAEFLREYRAWTEGLSDREIDVLIEKEMLQDLRGIDPRNDIMMMSFEEMLAFFEIRLD